MVSKYLERPRKNQIASQHTAKRTQLPLGLLWFRSFGQIHKYISAKISVSSMCCLSVICRPLSNREPLNEFSLNFILEHWNGCQCVSKFSLFGYALQQHRTLHMIFRAYLAKYLSERKIFRTDVGWRNETRNLCPVHCMPRLLRRGMKHAIFVRYIVCPDCCVEEWNTQFVSGTLYAWGHAVAQLAEALRYKSEGRGFDSRWCHWNFSLT